MSKNQRDPEKEALWRERIGAWKSSRHTVTEFCLINHYNVNTFRAWHRVIINRDEEKKSEAGRAIQTHRRRFAKKVRTGIEFAAVKLIETKNEELVATEIKCRNFETEFIEVVTPQGFTVRLKGFVEAANFAMILKTIQEVSC